MSNSAHAGLSRQRFWLNGKQEIEDTGPLTGDGIDTSDEGTLAAAKDFIKRKHEAGAPWMCWWNATRMHFRTHVKEEHKNLAGPNSDEYHDGMVEHDMHVGELLAFLDELGIAENTVVLYSTDNGPHYNTWPDAANTPFRNEKNSNWEGAFRVPSFVRWPGKLLMAHGNRELIDFYLNRAETYQRMGFTVLLGEYRGYGRSAGKPSRKRIASDYRRFYDLLISLPQ